MTDNGMNIYKTAREYAGITQERAAAALNVATRTLAAYETGERIPHDDIVVRMVDAYNYQQLAVAHMRASSELARRVIPDIRKKSLLAASVKFFNAVKQLETINAPERLLEISEDGRIDEQETEDYETIAAATRILIQSAMELMTAEQED